MAQRRKVKDSESVIADEDLVEEIALPFLYEDGMLCVRKRADKTHLCYLWVGRNAQPVDLIKDQNFTVVKQNAKEVFSTARSAKYHIGFEGRRREIFVAPFYGPCVRIEDEYIPALILHGKIYFEYENIQYGADLLES